ncbi:MAG: AmmeMemoRadiSam system radical SAM enzyme [Candidatus Binatia bacterium]|nr:MAG: AmmeMemoRadiSam system radical SAM enzyme [Candidatus Binatia bacterium]
MLGVATLKEILEARTAEAAPELHEKLPDKAVRCYACGHRCYIPEGRVGICKVRFNRGGTLYVPKGYVAALQCDPIEKKPFFHVRPGALALSFGMLGCDYHCAYCQNWLTSQALRDPAAVSPIHDIRPEEIVELALQEGAEAIVSTYNEPLITSEWAVDVFRVAKQHGLLTGYVSNGNGTPQVLEYIRPWTDLYKIDLKGFDDKHYRKLGGVLQNVLDTIRNVHKLGFWLEVVTLVVPGFNDSDEELRNIARFLAGVSPDIPWHVTAFHPDYKMTDRDRTSVETLLRAARIGEEEGLRYVYAGNIPGRVGRYEDTRCPSCGKAVIERTGYLVRKNHLKDGRCPDCGTSIPGVWRKPQARDFTYERAVPRPVWL